MVKAPVKKKPAAQDDSAAFDALANDPKYKKAWKEAKKVDAGDSFGNPELEDGRYSVRITSVKCGLTKAKAAGGARDPYMSIAGTIVSNDEKYNGLKVSIYFGLTPDRMDFAVKALKRLGYEFDDDSSLTDVRECCEDLNGTKPLIQISAVNKVVDTVDKKTKKKVKKPVLNTYIDRLLSNAPPDADEGEEVEEDEEAEDEEVEDEEGADDEETEDESEDEDESEEEESEDEGEEGTDDESLEVGDSVKYKEAGSKKTEEWAVTALNSAGTKATLKNVKTKKVLKNVPVDALEVIYEE
jgi:hypothetical protein